MLQSLSSESVDPLVQARIMSERMPKHVHDHVFHQPDSPLNIPKKYESFIWFATPMKASIKLLVEYDKQNQLTDSQVAFQPRYRRA